MIMRLKNYSEIVTGNYNGARSCFNGGIRHAWRALGRRYIYRRSAFEMVSNICWTQKRH